jgi:hypothetical protein
MKAVFSGNSAAAVVLFLNAMPCQFLLHHAATVKKNPCQNECYSCSVKEISSTVSQSDESVFTFYKKFKNSRQLLLRETLSLDPNCRTALTNAQEPKNVMKL